MKTRLLLLILLFSLKAYSGKASAEDSLLHRIQQKMDAAFAKSLLSKNTNALMEQEEKLSKIKDNPLAQYWNAYAFLHEAICYDESGNKKASYAKVKQGLKAMKRIENRTSEDYALLAYLQSFSMQFMGNMSMEAGLMNATVVANIEKALELDKENVRAWFMRGSHNYYTPKTFGGGKLAEESLTKAINLEEKNINNPCRPTWGKDQAYGLLVSFYLDNKRMDEAKKILEEGLKLYPQDYPLREHEKAIFGK